MPQWRGAGVVERARLENEYSREAIEGSNPSFSAVKALVTRRAPFVLPRLTRWTVDCRLEVVAPLRRQGGEAGFDERQMVWLGRQKVGGMGGADRDHGGRGRPLKQFICLAAGKLFAPGARIMLVDQHRAACLIRRHRFLPVEILR